MIQVSHLSFSYTPKPFIQDMNFSVAEGEIFGFLGAMTTPGFTPTTQMAA